MLTFTAVLRNMFETGRDSFNLPNTFLKIPFAALTLAIVFSVSLLGQSVSNIPYKSQEMSEENGVPVLMMHLPDWQDKRQTAAFATNAAELEAAVGEWPIIDLIDLTGGSEAVTAQYDAGKLLIVEFASPQMSVEADTKINAAIEAANDGKTFNRRTGNYNILVFDASDSRAANALIDQVKYEKQITWLGKNPFVISAERAFVITTADIFLSTLLVIVGGVVASIISGLMIGFAFFYFRDGKRSKMTAYTDAGGMTRLNLDGFTPDIAAERLIGD